MTQKYINKYGKVVKITEVNDVMFCGEATTAVWFRYEDNASTDWCVLSYFLSKFVPIYEERESYKFDYIIAKVIDPAEPYRLLNLKNTTVSQGDYKEAAAHLAGYGPNSGYDVFKIKLEKV